MGVCCNARKKSSRQSSTSKCSKHMSSQLISNCILTKSNRIAMHGFIDEETLRCAKDVIIAMMRESMVANILFDRCSSTQSDSMFSHSKVLCAVYNHSMTCLICRSRGQRRREGRRLKFQEVTSWLFDDEFKYSFRMNRESFMQLVHALLPSLAKNDDMGRRSSDGTVEPQVRLGVALRLLAGASVADMMILFHIGRSTVYECLQTVTKAIGKHLKLPGIPTDPDECRSLQNG